MHAISSHKPIINSTSCYILNDKAARVHLSLEFPAKTFFWLWSGSMLLLFAFFFYPGYDHESVPLSNDLSVSLSNIREPFTIHVVDTVIIAAESFNNYGQCFRTTSLNQSRSLNMFLVSTLVSPQACVVPLNWVTCRASHNRQGFCFTLDVGLTEILFLAVQFVFCFLVTDKQTKQSACRIVFKSR